ncbi:transcriptional regulator of acetoin/glycerol metabolism [Variovorax sp. Sphag1AA]|nr:transcriptional regulator of acetoin/glycerol metabolism [Variovorax sp. Sphag1AA]
MENRRIDPEPLGLALLQQRREQAMQLLRCAQPELDGLAEHAAASGCVVVLSDASGLILEEIGSPEFLPKAQQVALQPGVDWSEGSRGTNAIGTALAEGEALTVLGREHYLDQIGVIGCAAAPIFTGRGDLVGALDISGDASSIDAHALGLVRLAACQVEHRMALATARGDLLRFHLRPALIGTPREALVMVEDGRVVGANRIALELLQRVWSDVLDLEVEAVLGTRWNVLEHQRGLLTLPGGQQIAALAERARAVAGSVRPQTGGRQVETSDADDVVAPLLKQAVRVLDEGVAVLVTGETGSGKDLFARSLHAASRRAKGPLVAVDCASLPESLIEAELFGYEEGAYTGARRRGMPGRIREAHGGVLFLDEIADMPLSLQTRLLRVLEERCVTPLGGGKPQPVDFDLVCATHGNLAALVEQGRFRADLMYRVAGFQIRLPALRERSDRGALIERLLAELGGQRKGLRLSRTALAALVHYPWPGNVRELRSVLRTLVALCEQGQTIDAADLPLQGISPSERDVPPTQACASGTLVAITDRAVEEAMAQCGLNVADAARVLGVHRSTIYRHLAARRRA